VNVLRNAAGRTNFATTAPVSAPVQRPAPLFTLEQVGAVTVNDAEITFADALGKALPAPAFSLRGVSGTISSIDTQAPDWAKKLEIVANLRGAQLTLSNLTKPIDFHTGELTIHGGGARSTFSLSVGSIDLAGAAAFAHLDPLTITFAVTGPELDFKTLAAFLDGARGSTSAPSKVRRLLARGTVKIGKVVFAPLAGSQLHGQLDLYTNAVRLNAWTLSAYGGTIRGNAELTGSAGNPIAVTAQAHGLNAAGVLAAAGAGSGNLTGALDTNFRLTTSLTRDSEQALKTAGTFVVRDGSLPKIGHFSYFGGDLRIAQERGYSNKLTLLGSEMQATLRGSFGFDHTLQYSGTGVVDPVTQGTALLGSSLLSSVEPILANVLPQDVTSTRVSVPFALRGTLENPQFAVAGTPQLIPAPGSGLATQLPTQLPTVQDLEKLIPGL
jgi:AsmA-like C-terminal region